MSNRLTLTALPAPSPLSPRSREYSRATIDNAEYNPVLMSAIGGPAWQARRDNR
ncbi:hypothetical protein I552_2050 [Mycobacterium xenopi 3993]|nr:hypothetical protein I552_2050 [Mycobacterium xenopi 3993]